ncbi:autotransporter outer membrane beta-barrel domain-containing protein [Bartonella sp. AP19HLJMH]|uniref:autotransporter outer membrane beta-barrel domain-containing protein n=1 Tax=Bartonella sp. AP19HLJMH TaxID=3243473 RepID=UPI0035CFBE05
MINVFKKRTRLYALTTSAFFFLQGVDVSIGNSLWSLSSLSTSLTSILPSFRSSSASPTPEVAELPAAPLAQVASGGVGGVPGGGAGVPSSAGGLGGAGVPGVGGGILGGVGDVPGSVQQDSLVESIPALLPPCSSAKESLSRASIFCDDGATHTLGQGEGSSKTPLKAGRYDRAIYVTGPLPTVINVSEISVVAEEGTDIKVVENKTLFQGEGRGSVFADGKSQLGAAINLNDTVVEGFAYGLGASSYGKVAMNSGSLHSRYVNAMASKEGVVLLENARVTAEIVGLWSDDKSVIEMKKGTLSLGDTTIGVIASEMGIVLLDGVSIQKNVSELNGAAQMKERSGELVLPEDSDRDDSSQDVGRIALLSRDGYISFKNGNFDVSDSIFLQIGPNISSNIVRNMQENINTYFEFEDEDEDENREEYLPVYLRSSHRSSNIFPKAFSDIFSSVYKARIQKESALGIDPFSNFLNLNAVIKSSSIKVPGKKSYGIDFDRRANGIQSEDPVPHGVLLEKTSLTVPEGVAIYGDGLKGYVFLQDGSEVSGSLLLKAKKSDLSVFANKSIISGATRFDDKSHAELFLSNGAEWRVKKSSYEDSEDADQHCIDSCISSVSLQDSAIEFFTSIKNLNSAGSNGGKAVTEYQILRIGKGKGTVYSAKGTSTIQFNVDVSGKAVDVSGKVVGRNSDRLLIHGDVSGQTKVKVKAQGVGWGGNNNKGYSISLIQVFGRAEESSFSLNGDYVTLGTPYQYVLRAYGPTIPSKMQYFDKALVAGSKDVWDFRLEDKNLPYERSSLFVSGGNRERAGVNTPSVPSREAVENEVDNSSVGSNLPSGTSESRPPNQIITSNTNGNPALLGRSDTGDVSHEEARNEPSTISDPLSSSLNTLTTEETVDGSEDPRQNANEVEYTIVGYGDSDTVGVNSGIHRTETGDEDHTDGGYEGSYDVESEASEAVMSIPSPTPSPVASTVSEGGASTDQGEDRTSEVVTSVPSSTTPSVASAVSEEGTSTDQGVGRTSEAVTSIPSPATSSVTSAVSEGGASTDQGKARTSEVVTSVPSSTTPSVASAVSEEGTSTDQGVGRTSEAVTSIPSPATSSVTSAVSEGGASTDQGKARTSETIPSLPSSTTSPVTPTVSEERASTNPARSGTSGHNVYTVSSNSSPSSRGRSSLNLIPSGANSLGRSDPDRVSVISTDGISVSSGHTISNKLPSIKSAASIKPSSEVSEKSSTPPNGSVGRIVPPNSIGKETISSTCDDMNNGEKGSRTIYLCRDGKSRTITGKTLKASEKTQHSMHAVNPNTVIKLEGTTISGADSSDSKDNFGVTPSKLVSAVLAEEGAEVVLDNKSTITSSVIGLEAKSGGKVKMIGGTVDALYVGALAGSGSSVNLKDTKINVTGDLAMAGLVSQAGKVSMDSGAITLEKGVAVRSEAGGSVELDKVNITAKKGQGKLDSVDNFGRAAFLVSDNASVDFKNGNVVTDAHALWIIKSGDNVVETGSSRRRRSSDVRPTMNHVNIESSTVKVEGDGVYGIYFDGGTQKEASQQNRSQDLTTEKTNVVKRSTVSKQEKTPIGITGTVSLKKTDFEVANGIAIYGNNSGGRVSLENKTTLAGDLLLKAENDSNILVSVDNSIVTGGVRVDKNSYAKLDLVNNSQWILKRSAQRNLGTLDSGCADSCISSVSLVNSAIDFAPSESEGKYQTLHIGNGKGTVYAAQGNAVIHLNARLNPRDPSDQQVTDRLVIHGDVSGKTKIHVRGDAGNVGDGKANAKIAHTVSIIQVYGQAKKDSFQLDGNYVALRNSPYKYTLRAYAPEATSKQEHVQQKFVKDGGEFWNFRLENQYVKSVGSAALPEQFVRSVVPQVPTYLSLPNSVFHAGLMDISNQNKQLETLRMTSTGMVEVRENPALYLRGYGGNYRYASDLSALEYGYGGDLSYNGVEAGVLLQTIENADSAISFGVMGTYGKLSLQPVNVEYSQKSAFDKWTATVYGSMQHNVGFYVDGLLSYGLFKGDVLTLARGKTATLKGNPLSVSLAGGQTIMTGYKGFVFDPQVQVVYQHLQFNKARDIDNFDIEMGNLNQWVARVGGRLTKIPTGSEGVNAIAFYGKLYLAHGFEGKQFVHFNDAFKLGAFGSSLEAGLGFNAKLLPQFSLYADILYQHKLNKAGFSGTSFSGGIRYQF